MGQGFLRGIDLYLKMQGISDERQRNAMLNKLTQMQMGALETGQQETQAYRGEIKKLYEGTQGISPPTPTSDYPGFIQEYGQGMNQGTPGMSQTDFLNKAMQLSLGYAKPETGLAQVVEMAKGLGPQKFTETDILSLSPTDPRRINFIKGKGELGTASNPNEALILSLPPDDLRRINYLQGKAATTKPATVQRVGLLKTGETVVFDPDKGTNFVTDVQGNRTPYVKSKHGDIDPMTVYPFFMFPETAGGLARANVRTGEITPTGQERPLEVQTQGALSFIGQIEDTAKSIQSITTRMKGWPSQLTGVYGATAGRALPMGIDYEQLRSEMVKLRDIVYPKSGKQINETELSTLFAYIPQETDKIETKQAKWEMFNRHLQSIKNNYLKQAGQAGHPSLLQPPVEHPSSDAPIPGATKESSIPFTGDIILKDGTRIKVVP